MTDAHFRLEDLFQRFESVVAFFLTLIIALIIVVALYRVVDAKHSAEDTAVAAG